ncbi:PTS sugar transporter subunit IIA [Lactiplantibacillus plantarum]|uniref:PTS sugar transporter subunit IIA n=1 Tax=Lactiplantibacillus plantarum TaxID=1590 RepID=UPI0010C5A233|nr:PTS sugar transporter subunit IIA [Lactiplantibacillus plantarum]
MEGKRGSECLLKSVSNIDFNPENTKHAKRINVIIGLAPIDAAEHVLALSQLVKLLQQPHWLANIENATNAQMVYDSCFPN